MRILIARHSGFCNGVRRAMRIAVEAAARNHGLQADGPLVHNAQAIELLALHGVGNANDYPGKPMLVRAHGVAPQQRDHWRDQNLELVDATCPHVAANQKKAADATTEGRVVLLAGDPDHAEVLAVAASAGESCRTVTSPEDIAGLDLSETTPVLLLAQTTFNVRVFGVMANAARRRFSDIVVADTICRATHDRQEETARLAARVEAMVVVGGRHSANTSRLVETARTAGIPVFPVETADELQREDFANCRVAGVTSGASTPDWITQEVVNRLRGFGRPRWIAFLMPLFLHLVRSRLTTAMAAGGLALAAQYFLLERLFPGLALAGAGYIFFSHTLNRRVPPNPAMRRLSLAETFYRRRRGLLLSLAWGGAGAALILAGIHGVGTLFLFLAAFAATLVHRLSSRGKEAAIRSPRAAFMFRNWAMALGWSAILTLPAALEAGEAVYSLGCGAFIFLLCLGGTLVRDLHDISSDHLLGINTLAAGLGAAKARKMAGRAFIVALILPFGACFAALGGGSAVPAAWYCFTLLCGAAPALGLILLHLLESNRLRDSVLLQAGVDAMGITAGLLALAAAAVS